jgi:hypothetical protein
MAQVFDIFGREFIIRHVTPFPGCVRAAGFGDWTPTAPEPPKLTGQPTRSRSTAKDRKRRAD